MRLLTLKIESFKGIQSREIDPRGASITICGENGTGKTTIVDAYYWLMTGKDSTLTDNPNVVPIGSTECMPTVTATFDMDGKTVTIRKVQRYKNKDGKESTTNQYIINDVPMTERDFKAKLEEYGIDDRFLALSHPDYLLNDTSKKGREYIRNKILFPMAQTLTDSEIAEKNGLQELVSGLKDYSLSEIEAMNKATLKRINDEIGKDNVIANARIDELSKGKVDVDVKAAEKQIAEQKQIIENVRKNHETRKKMLEDDRLRVLELTMDRNAIVSALNDDTVKKKRDLEDSCLELSQIAIRANNEFGRIGMEINVKQETVESLEKRNTYLTEKITAKKDLAVDVPDVCPTCGQPYPKEMAKQIRENASKENYRLIADYNTEIDENKALIESAKTEIANLYAKRDEVLKKLNDLDEKMIALRKEINSIVVPDATKDKRYKDISKRIEKIQADIDSYDPSVFAKEEEDSRTVIHECEKVIDADVHNKVIDGRIGEIRQEIKQAEINRANAEKMLYQIECLNKAKNELLEESVNKHFTLVKWKLFRTLKNGNIEDACIPMIDGFDIGTANHGRTILAKLDIVNGLSKYYGKNYPVFIDNAESLSSCTEERINIDNQVVTMKVTESKELEVK